MAINIARRKFIAALGGAAFAWPQASRAQQADRMRRVGMLETRAADDPEEQTSRPKNNSSATLKAARSRANRRRHYRTNLIPRRNATSPIRTAAS
jgi:hypothetical protein